MAEKIPTEREAAAKLLEVLEEDPPFRPTPKAVKKVAQELFPDMDIEEVAKRAFRKAYAWTAEAIEALRTDLGISTDPSDQDLKRLALEVRSTLRRGLEVEVKFDHPDGAIFHVCGKGERPVGGYLCTTKYRFRLRGFSPSPNFAVTAKAGRVEARVAGGLALRRRRAFLRAVEPEQVEAALAEVRSLPSFLAVMGLSDLKRALVALSKLEEDEVRREGSYLLVREGDTRILRRGTLLGSPDLDAALLLGKHVTLSYPRGLEIALKGKFELKDRMALQDFALRFEGEEARYDGGLFWGPASGDLRYRLASLMRGTLKFFLERASRSPKMRALVEELARSEDPLEAPKDEAFFRRLELRFLTKF
jgi:hypothetical protein